MKLDSDSAASGQATTIIALSGSKPTTIEFCYATPAGRSEPATAAVKPFLLLPAVRFART